MLQPQHILHRKNIIAIHAVLAIMDNVYSMKKYALMFLCVCFVSHSAWAKTCTPSDANAADKATDTLTNWRIINQNRVKFGHCDEGGVAEGNSEAVARLLVDHWDSLAELNTLSSNTPALKKYVLRHIDSTLDTNDLDQIQRLSAQSCPQGLSALCTDIGHAAERAIQAENE